MLNQDSICKLQIIQSQVELNVNETYCFSNLCMDCGNGPTNCQNQW